MIRHFAGVAEIVEDVNAALAFYRDTLGLEVKQQMGDDYAVVAVPGVLHFGIWNRGHAALSTFGSRDAADRIPLGFTIEFEVDDRRRRGRGKSPPVDATSSSRPSRTLGTEDLPGDRVGWRRAGLRRDALGPRAQAASRSRVRRSVHRRQLDRTAARLTPIGRLLFLAGRHSSPNLHDGRYKP